MPPPQQDALAARISREFINCLTCVSAKQTAKKAFTLAEVLITLGIIGVVAAMTMPVLIQNSQRKETGVQLSKFYSVMNQAVMRWKDDEGIIDGDQYFSTSDVRNMDSLFTWYNNGIGKYIQAVNVEKDEYYLNVALNDGSGFVAYIGTVGPEPAIYFFYCTKQKYCAPESFDGKRTFLFTLYKGKFMTSYPPSNGLSRDQLLENCKKGDTSMTEKTTGRRHDCTRLIQTDGWELKKDYPWEQIIPQD